MLHGSAHGTLMIVSSGPQVPVSMRSSASLVTVSASPSLPPQPTVSLPPSPETLMVSPPSEPDTELERELPVMLSAPSPPKTRSMNGAVAASQVTVFVPSVAVPVARFTVRLAVTAVVPQVKQRSSLSAWTPGWSPSPVISSCPQPGSKMYWSRPGLSTSVSSPAPPERNSNPGVGLGPALRVSLPEPPSKGPSNPSWPKTSSFPPRAMTASLPPRALTMSARLVPVMVSARLVPTHTLPPCLAQLMFLASATPPTRRIATATAVSKSIVCLIFLLTPLRWACSPVPLHERRQHIRERGGAYHPNE